MTDELQEKVIWQNVNSSIEKGKILKGKIIAIETEKLDDNLITCGIVDFKGIKVMIPAKEIIKEKPLKKEKKEEKEIQKIKVDIKGFINNYI